MAQRIELGAADAALRAVNQHAIFHGFTQSCGIHTLQKMGQGLSDNVAALETEHAVGSGVGAVNQSFGGDTNNGVCGGVQNRALAR